MGSQAEVAALSQRARERFADWRLDELPPCLRRNGLDYYYLSVWPGLRQLSAAASLALPTRPARTEHAYIHVPFCSGLCDFCSYFLAVVRGSDAQLRIATYIDDLLREIVVHQQASELALSYVYLGGGTPSLVPPDEMHRLLDGLARLGALAPRRLGTVELHPELFLDTSRAAAFLDVVRAHGLGRVSIGLQSHEARLLDSTNRRHGAGFLDAAFALVRDRGFTVNLDLMYGLPGQTLAGWIESLLQVVALCPDSISTYFTFIDPGTGLWHDLQAGRIALPTHTEVQTQHIAAQLLLDQAGYLELPNDFHTIPLGDPAGYVQDSLPSQANSLALGAGAYGYFPGVQYFNEFSFRRHAAAVRSGRPPIWRAAVLSPFEELCRDIMFSLKNAPHLDFELFRARHGTTPAESHALVMAELVRLDLVELRPERLRLSAKGRLMVEEIACLFAARRPDPPVPAQDLRKIEKHHFAARYPLVGLGPEGPH